MEHLTFPEPDNLLAVFEHLTSLKPDRKLPSNLLKHVSTDQILLGWFLLSVDELIIHILTSHCKIYSTLIQMKKLKWKKASETCFAFSQRQALLIDADIYLAFDLPVAWNSSSNINKEINKILTKNLWHETSFVSPAETQTKHQIKNSKALEFLSEHIFMLLRHFNKH